MADIDEEGNIVKAGTIERKTSNNTAKKKDDKSKKSTKPKIKHRKRDKLNKGKPKPKN